MWLQLQLPLHLLSLHFPSRGFVLQEKFPLGKKQRKITEEQEIGFKKDGDDGKENESSFLVSRTSPTWRYSVSDTKWEVRVGLGGKVWELEWKQGVSMI